MTKNQLTNDQKNLIERWEKFAVPIRPSKGVIECYEKNILTAIKNKSKPVWGLLGCTPEIRSIAGKYQAEIVCLDRNEDAFHAYKTICSPSEYEKFVCTDWLDMPTNNMFDVVLGDGALSMLAKEDHSNFLTNIHKIINPKGFLVLKIHISAPLVFDSPEKVFEWYRKENKDAHAYFAITSYLYALWLNPNNLKVSINEYMVKADELYQRKIITEKEYIDLNEVKKSKVSVQYTTKDIFEELISDLFEIISIDYAGDYPLHTNNPIYFLQKK